MTKKIDGPDDLSARDKHLLDLYATGKSRKELAAQFDIVLERVGQIVRRPASVAYLARQASTTKTLLFARAGEELLTRMDWGGMKLADLLAIWKAAMPQEVSVNVNVKVRQEAEKIAAEYGLSVAEVLAEAELVLSGGAS